MQYELYDRGDFKAKSTHPVPAQHKTLTDYMLLFFGVGSAAASPESIQTEVKRLVSKGKIGDAISRAIKYHKKNGEQMTLMALYELSNRWHDFNAERNQGTLDEREEMIQQAEITASLLKLVA